MVHQQDIDYTFSQKKEGGVVEENATSRSLQIVL